jgi:adenylyltransferase/sulfurtransferase
MDYITPTDLKKQLDSNATFTLLDIREQYELDICQIGGVHIPMSEVSARANELDANAQTAVLCRSGKRAEAVANFLATDADFSHVSIVKGGILAWITEVDSSLESY